MEVYVPEETSGCLYHIWRLVTSPPFENFILFLIVLNTLLLMMKVRNIMVDSIIVTSHTMENEDNTLRVLSKQNMSYLHHEQ